MMLIKNHGLGNDYLVLHTSSLPPLSEALVVALCDRHRGPGGDGILERLPSSVADYGLRIWNPDGSLAEKSGNGLRIFSRYLVDYHRAPADFTVEVAAGVVRCAVDASGVTVEMGRATFEPDGIPCRQPLEGAALAVEGASLEVTAVGVGNPHCVAFFPPEADLDGLPWRAWGAALERHPLFPNRTNVQFARVLGPDAVEIRIWERGAGETMASGSSSCAAAAAAVRRGLVPAGDLRVVMPGGTLYITVGADFSLTMRGPVEEVCAITLSPSWLAAHA